MSETSRWWRPRFRLASLLWLMLCVALTIGAYRRGYQSGHEDALNKRTFVGNSYAKVYYVAEIVPQTTTPSGVVVDFDSLMCDLKRDVLPYTWDDQGGAATMAEFPTNLSLVVAHDEDGHERIGEWIRKRREQAAKLAPANTATTSAGKTASR